MLWAFSYIPLKNCASNFSLFLLLLGSLSIEKVSGPSSLIQSACILTSQTSKHNPISRRALSPLFSPRGWGDRAWGFISRLLSFGSIFPSNCSGPQLLQSFVGMHPSRLAAQACKSPLALLAPTNPRSLRGRSSAPTSPSSPRGSNHAAVRRRVCTFLFWFQRESQIRCHRQLSGCFGVKRLEKHRRETSWRCLDWLYEAFGFSNSLFQTLLALGWFMLIVKKLPI